MIIFHGDHNVSSRQATVDARADGVKKGLNILDYSGSGLTLSELSQKAESTSLLGETNLIFISDFFARRPGKEKTAILEYLKTHSNLPLVFWESKDVTSQLTGLPTTTIKKFDLPKYIFKFLDSFSLELLDQTIQNTSPEQIMVLLSRRVRDLILAKLELLTGPDWKTRQISYQSQKYNLEKLKKLYSDLLKIDFTQKTSQMPYDLTSALELWVVNALR